MKKIQMNKLNLFLLLNISLAIFAEIDITQKGATGKIVKTDEVFFTGIVKMPTCKNSDLELCMCYNGDIIKIRRNDNLFMIKDSRKDRLNILFTSPENFSIDSQDNTVLFFKLKEGNSYKFFKLLKRNKESNFIKKSDWDITDANLPISNDKIVVPLNTLIIPIDPSTIDILFEKMISKEGSKIVKLPTIVIEGQNFCDLEKQINKCCLAFMNLKPFHCKQSKKEVIQDNLKVCLVN